MDTYSVNEVVLLATNLILAPCLIYLGIWGYRDSEDFAEQDSLEDNRLASRRRADRYPRIRDRRRYSSQTVIERRSIGRRAHQSRRQDDRRLNEEVTRSAA